MSIFLAVFALPSGCRTLESLHVRGVPTLGALFGFLLTLEVLRLSLVLLAMVRLALLVRLGFLLRRLLMLLRLSMLLLGGRRSTIS